MNCWQTQVIWICSAYAGNIQACLRKANFAEGGVLEINLDGDAMRLKPSVKLNVQTSLGCSIFLQKYFRISCRISGHLPTCKRMYKGDIEIKTEAKSSYQYLSQVGSNEGKHSQVVHSKSTSIYLTKKNNSTITSSDTATSASTQGT